MAKGNRPVAAGIQPQGLCARLRLLFCGILTFGAAALAGAQTLNSGGTESPFELGGSAWALGMGGAVAAVSGYGDGFFENPAALATVQEHEILTFHAPLFLDTLYDSVGYINPIGSNNSFGLAITRLGISNIPETTTTVQALSNFSSEEYEGILGYGFRLLPDLDFGGNVKFVYQQLGAYQGSGGGLGLGHSLPFLKNPRGFLPAWSQEHYLGILGFQRPPAPNQAFPAGGDNPARVFRPAFSYYYHFPGSTNDLWLTAEGEIPVRGRKARESRYAIPD